MKRAAGAALSALLLASSGEASAEPQRFALSMMHFNVQYVAGGLAGFYDGTDAALDLPAEAVEDRIVTESLQPVLELFLQHPSFGANIELQGYMLDVMAARHPDVLDELRALATSGQIDVVSFHYSDQLFLAHPREDWARSAELNRATFEKHGVPLSRTVFCQEGQSGPGVATAMAEHGYDTLLWPKNLFSYQHGEGEPAPLYDLGGVRMVTSRGLSYDDGSGGVEATFWFVDDGELLATDGIDPYFPEQFHAKPEAIAKVESELEALEAQGYAITTVAKYVDAIVGHVPAVEAPPLLDGTWQPGSTDGIHRWLGGFGLWWKGERDGDVRTLAATAHRELLAAETIAAEAGLPDTEDEIAAGFRLLALGEVSDASGINPFRGEVEYGIAHLTEALRIARDVVERGKEALGAAEVRIDPGARSVEVNPPPPAAAEPAGEAAPILVSSGDRTADVAWTKLAPGHSLVTIAFGIGDERLVSVTFPGTSTDIVYTPGLAEEPVRVPRSAFVFDHYELALSDGLIGVSDGVFVIEDQAHVHASAKIVPGSGDVVFHDDTAPAGERAVWVFHVVTGTLEDAAAVARSVNLTPEVRR